MNDLATPDLDFLPTTEQLHIIGLLTTTSDNILIRALAGSGKTSTLLLIILHAVARDILFLAFNTRIKDAMVEKYEELALGHSIPPIANLCKGEHGTDIRTFNSLGLAICRTLIGGTIVVNTKKMQEIVHAEIRSLRTKAAQSEAWDSTTEIYGAINMAKSLGYVPVGHVSSAKGLTDEATFYAKLDENPTGLVQDIVESSLATSIRLAYHGNIDFNDQLYMPALFGGTYPRPELILVDEKQDLNPVQYEMLWRMRRSRIVGVGDENQSIYEFRGAVPGAMAMARERFNMTTAELTTCFRCPQAVVEGVHWRVPQMKWVKPGGINGILRTPKPSDFVDGGAIICRNNAPLFALAFRLLGAGRNVTVVGSDIGTRVVNILRKLGPGELTQAQVLLAIDKWLEEKLSRESKTCADTAECMRVFARQGKNLEWAITYAQSLFAQEGPLTLITGHKAKGLEWDHVYHLDPWLIKDAAGEQELNLRYVIQTRALQTYHEFNSAEVDWS